MMDQHVGPEVPKLTPTEAVAGLLTVATVMPHIPNPIVSAGFLLPLAAVWAARRSAVLRNWVETWQDSNEYRIVDIALSRIPVPATERRVHKALPQPRPKPERLLTAPERAPRKTVNWSMPKLTLPDSLIELLGEDGESYRAKPADEITVLEAEYSDSDVQPKARKTKRKAENNSSQSEMMSLAEVVDLINNNVDEFPHFVIFGDTGSGKTELMQYILSQRGGEAVILDPKRPQGWKDPKWGGVPYISLDRETGDYTPMVRGLQAVVDEMRRRYRVAEEVTEPFTELTVVLDEAKVSVEECERLAELYRKIVSIGREAVVRLGLISTSDRAGKLGFSGEADSMESLVQIRLGNAAVKVLGEEQCKQMGPNRYNWAAVFLKGRWVPFSTKLPDGPRPRVRLWDGAAHEWNCQTGNTRSYTPVASAPVAVAARMDNPFDLLEELLSVNDFEAEGTAEGIAEGTEGTRKELFLPTPSKSPSTAFPPPTAAFRRTPSTFREGTEGPRKGQNSRYLTLDELSAEEREDLKKTLQLIARGASKWQAIKSVTGAAGGRKYQRMRSLVDLALSAK